MHSEIYSLCSFVFIKILHMHSEIYSPSSFVFIKILHMHSDVYSPISFVFICTLKFTRWVVLYSYALWNLLAEKFCIHKNLHFYSEIYSLSSFVFILTLKFTRWVHKNLVYKFEGGKIFLSPNPFIKSKTSNAHNSKTKRDKSILKKVASAS